jgi:hypothetical protein
VTHRVIAVLLALSLLGLSLLVLSACGSDSSDDSASPPESSATTSAESSPASSEACDTLGALQDDVASMTTASSVQQFTTAYNAAKKDFADLKPALGASYGGDVDAIGQAMTDFGDALKSFGDQGALQGLQDLGKAAGNLQTAVTQLATDLPCPSSS